MKQLILLFLIVLPAGIFAQHLFSVSSTYGVSKMSWKTFNTFVESFNAHHADLIDKPLEKFSGINTFEFMISGPFVRIGFTNTEAAAVNVSYKNGEGRSFSYNESSVSLGLNFSTEYTKEYDEKPKPWAAFTTDFLYGWQDITTAYQYQPGQNYFGVPQKDLNGQYEQGTIRFQSGFACGYKYKNFSLFVKGNVHFPNLLNFQLHNLERSTKFYNLSYLPTDYGKYYEDPFSYDMEAIDNPDMQVSSRNWIFTLSAGVSFSFYKSDAFLEY